MTASPSLGVVAPKRPTRQARQLIGQPKACALAVRNVRAMRRLTTLVARLRLGEPAMGTRG